MNIFLINVPSRKGKGAFFLPLGLLYLGSIIERSGHRAKIFDPYLEDAELVNYNHKIYGTIDKIIEDYKPSIIGFGGISTSYGRVKILSCHIKEKYPDILQIAGGPLASVYELLLANTKVDLVFHGEAEISFPLFLEKYEQNKAVYNIPGISHLSDDKRIITTPPPQQVKNIDSIPFPSYHLVDLKRYFCPIKDWLYTYNILLNNNPKANLVIKKIGSKTHYLPLNTARGCTHKCSFCYRHMRGIRQHSPAYVINHMKYLIDTYGVRAFYFADELFNSDPEWVFELCDLIEREDLDIFYLIMGARVDKINEKMLRRLRDTGCIEISYGHESGSDTILKDYRKGVTVNQNYETTVLTTNTGISCPVQIVIGSPSETNDTINETIQFLKSVDAYQFSLNYLIPLPETPIWSFVMKNRLITDVEKYLNMVADYGGAPLVNLTKMSNKTWRRWGLLIRREMKLYYCKRRGLRWRYFYSQLFFTFIDKVRPFMPLWLVNWVRYLFGQPRLFKKRLKDVKN